MTPAELLLAAADRIDQALAAATPGPWYIGVDDCAWISIATNNRADPLVQSERSGWPVAATGHGETAEADAAWIALLNPQVGEPLAALLRMIGAWHSEGFDTCSGIDRTNYPDAVKDITDDALALARAILGEDA
jgi:hypothetical protein